jgi:hypothetical protein
MYDGVSSMQKLFVHLCDEFRTDSFQVLKRESIICFLPMTDLYFAHLFPPTLGFFFLGMRLKWMEKASKQAGSKMLSFGWLFGFCTRTAESFFET